MKQEKFNQMSDVEKQERDRLGKALRTRIWVDGYTQGRVLDVMMALEPRERKWLLEQVPDGGSIADALILLVRDAYFENEEWKDAQ
jgi:hypothetical protein